MLKQKADRIITEYLQKIYGFAVKKSFYYDEAEDYIDNRFSFDRALPGTGRVPFSVGKDILFRL